MSSIDLLTKRSVNVACALDLGGGATSERVKEAIRILFHKRQCKSLRLLIFSVASRVAMKLRTGSGWPLKRIPAISLLSGWKAPIRKMEWRSLSTWPMMWKSCLISLRA